MARQQVRQGPFSKLPSQPNSAAKSAGSPAVDSNSNAADIAVNFAAEVGGEVGGVKELASRAATSKYFQVFIARLSGHR